MKANATTRDTIEAEDLLTRADARATQLFDGLTALAVDHPYAAGVRGRGLLLGLELDAPVAKQVEQAFLLAFARPPSEDEKARMVELLGSSAGESGKGSLVALCRVLFNTSEFIYID